MEMGASFRPILFLRKNKNKIIFLSISILSFEFNGFLNKIIVTGIVSMCFLLRGTVGGAPYPVQHATCLVLRGSIHAGRSFARCYFEIAHVWKLLDGRLNRKIPSATLHSGTYPTERFLRKTSLLGQGDAISVGILLNPVGKRR